MSRLFDTQPVSDLLLVLDLQRDAHFGGGAASTLEYAVSVAASICHTALTRGRAVGLICNDAAGTAFLPGRGDAQRLRILNFLALADADGSEDLALTIQRRRAVWRGRGGLAVITPSRDPAWVAAVIDAGVPGFRHLCIAIDAVSFGAPGPGLRISPGWRLALDWRQIRRGDDLDSLARGSRAAASR